jgi:hypothetical protein
MKTKIILSLLLSLLVSIVSGLAISTAIGAPALPFVTGIFIISIIPIPQLAGVAFATVYQEVWTKKVKEELSTKEKGTFLDGIEDFSQYVANVGDEMQVIHLVYMGVMPDVLINNVTYPIPLQELGQEDIPISLDKYQTKVTPVTDDELYALSYEKIAKVKDKHAKAIMIAKVMKSIHALAPTAETDDMPVLLATGPNDGTGRRRLIWDDVVTLKEECDKREHPETGRRLVLSAEHANDLIRADQKFKDQFYNRSDGTVYNQLGFDFYSYVANPYFNPATKAKLSYGAVVPAGHRRASVYFNLARAAKAVGWTKMYFSEAKTDPQNQRNLVNFRHYYIVLPTREDARAAIVSPDYAE